MRIGIDSGGTFTDVVALDERGELRFAKVPSVREDPAAAVFSGLRLVEGDARGPTARHQVTHGTTVATNALLERAGGPTALVTTAGFEDVLVLRRQARPELYALHPTVPTPLCPDELCFGLVERLGPNGEVVTALDERSLDELVVKLRDLIGRGEVRSIAIALLHSYASDRHEALVATRLQALGVPLSVSSKVLPEHREYERTVTTVVDAYVAPVVGGYLSRVAHELEGAGSSLGVMQSSGGAGAWQLAARHPVHTLLSGPAAGVVGARAVASRAGVDRLITFDMGGTSTDVSVVDGELEVGTEREVAGLPVRVPSLRVHTIGAGGGSIAWIDQGGALKVGPRSAGASPGPACYGRGGEDAQPTVTDAMLVLGRLHADHFLGGSQRLDEAAARRSLGRLGAGLGLPERAIADGIARIATVVMARAIRVVSAERGDDPRDFTLTAFGGAGGQFACGVAEEIGMRSILVPPAPGLLCAYGALVADVTRDYTATRLGVVGAGSGSIGSPAARAPLWASALAGEFAPLEELAHHDLDEEGISGERRLLHRRVDLRYRGQSYELSVELPRSDADLSGFDVIAAFDALHHRRYGFSDARRLVERVALRVHAVGLSPAPPPLRVRRETSDALIGELDGTRVLRRDGLAPGALIVGPAMVVEYSGTTWIAPGWRGFVDGDGAIHLSAI